MKQLEIPMTLQEFAKTYKTPSFSALRDLIHNRHLNGLEVAFIKVGARRMVLPDTLFRIMRDRGNEK